MERFTEEEVQEFGTPVGTLSPGTWFACILATQDLGGSETVTGQVVYGGVGSVLVELDRSWERRVRWAPEALVVELPTPESVIEIAVQREKEIQIHNKEHKRMATQAAVPDSVLQNLQARYNFQQGKLLKALDEDNGDAISSAQAAISRIENEAKEQGVALQPYSGPSAPPPTNESEAPANVAPSKGGKAKKPAAKSVAGKEKVAAKAAAVAADKAAGNIPGATKPKKAKKAPVMRPCLDGCGTLVGGNFKMGHDAKLKSLILKIERGKMVPGDIPEISQGIVKFVKGEVETEKKDGKMIRTQLYVCKAAPVRFPGRDDIAFTEREAS